MTGKTVMRYSNSFRRQVVSDLESGRMTSVRHAQRHYGIRGNGTVESWVRRFGKNHLLPKVITVQKLNEPDQIRQLQQQITQLQQALGQTQVDNILNRQFLKLACEELGCDIEAFKKKVDIAPSTEPGKKTE